MFGLGILKGTIIGLGIGVIASFAIKDKPKKLDKYIPKDLATVR